MSIKKLKILQVMPEFGLAGAEIMCENLCKQLHNKGYEVVIVSLFNIKSAITRRIEKANIPIYYLNKKIGFDLTIISEIKKIIKKEHINLIHTHRYILPYVFPAAYQCGVRCCVHTVHNMAKFEVNSIRRKFSYYLYKYKKVIPVSISPLVQQSISDEYHLAINKIPMIFNGIDLSKCIQKNDYEIKDIFKFIHIGRFSTQKNHSIMIDAIYELKNLGIKCQLKLIGDGELKLEIMEKVDKLGLQNEIEFLGLQDDVYSFLHNADCFLLPSIYEGMPVSLIEALGTGLPVIVSNVGGIPDMINNEETGLIINPKVSDLIKAMMRVVNDKDLREYLGSRAVVRARDFSDDYMADKYIELYENLYRNVIINDK